MGHVPPATVPTAATVVGRRQRERGKATGAVATILLRTAAVTCVLAAVGAVSAPAEKSLSLRREAPSSNRGWRDWGDYGSTERLQQISDFAGSASFFVWLFAQSPQLYENYRNSSCDGLSFVFLIQWMAGDATNLLGCLLTGQLPFQIAIATYFCCIDLCIMAQYYFYWHRDRRLVQLRRRAARLRKGSLSTTRSTSARHLGRPVAAQKNDMSMSASLSSLSSSHRASPAPRSRSKFSAGERAPSANMRASGPSPRPARNLHGVFEAADGTAGPSSSASFPRPRMHSPYHSYRALEQAAKSVAELASEAERASAQHEARKRRRRARVLAEARQAAAVDADGDMDDKDMLDSPELLGRSVNSLDGVSSDDEDVELPESMRSSVVSTASRSSSEGVGSSSGQRSTPNLQFSTLSANPKSPGGSSSRRGRNMSRMAGKIAADQQQLLRQSSATGEGAAGPAANEGPSSSPRVPLHRSLTRSSQRGTSLSSARQTGLVLLGIGALFGFSGYEPKTSLHKRTSYAAAGTGSNAHFSVVLESSVARPNWNMDTVQGPYGLRLVQDEIFEEERSANLVHYVPTASQIDDDRQAYPPPSWERLVGRISAWTCTILYMTSRLPQIWTNMQRRSVQGLSILLFIAAATGNLLYTISVLANPKAHVPPSTMPERMAYLLESLPFLLGSGGTLVFDGIIVCQWLAWRGKAPSAGLGVATSHGQGAGSGHSLGSHGGTDGIAPVAASSVSALHSYRSASRPGGTRSRWQSLERQPLLE